MGREAAWRYPKGTAAFTRVPAKLLPTIAICLLLGACVPIYTDEDAPRIAGVLLDGGRAIADADVELFSIVSHKSLHTRTDSDGRFSIGPLQDVEFFVLPMGDHFVSYGLRFRADGHSYASEGSMIPAWAHTEGLICDISAPGGSRKDRHTIFLDARIPPSARESPTSGLRCWDPHPRR
jgi:hypothetical protein